MKKSAQVTLTVVAALGLTGCSRRPDPCAAETFNPDACQEAVRDGGYYYGGHWYGMPYGHSYPYYYNNYYSHVSRGGSVHAYSSSSYAHPAGGVARGGFGSTGHGAAGA
jgi:hypothetical protein